MKHLFLLGCLVGLTAACTSRQTTDASTSATIDSSQTAPATMSAPATVALTARLTGLGMTTDHDWRKVTLGDAFTAAKATETAQPFEQDAAHVGYSQEFTNLESVDYQYIQEGEKVTSIQVDLYLNTVQSVKAYGQELTTYLTARYGNPTITLQSTTWKNGTVTLKDVSKGKDFGLKLVIK